MKHNTSSKDFKSTKEYLWFIFKISILEGNNKLYYSWFSFIYFINRCFANLKPTWKSYPFIYSIAIGEQPLVIVLFID